jgi:metal-responsive CopG/Arc/MetJ family transcriptional regulator
MYKMKVNVTLNDDLLAKVDQYADENGMTRSGLIAVALGDYLSARELTSAIKSIAFTMQDIASKGEVDEEAQKQLDDFQRLVNLLYRK